jgi:hypothetical protein
MGTMKVSELTGAQLDYWVAKANGMDAKIVPQRVYGGYGITFVDGTPACQVGIEYFDPSTNWAIGGPIIDQGRIVVEPLHEVGEKPKWQCGVMSQYGFEGPESDCWMTGDTMLIAAMRALVAKKYGDEVPDET